MVFPNSPLTPVTKPPPPPLKYKFSRPTFESVTASVMVYSTKDSETLLTVVVNTSTGGDGGWFGFCSQILDAPMKPATIGMSNSSSWGGEGPIARKIGRVHGL